MAEAKVNPFVKAGSKAAADTDDAASKKKAAADAAAKKRLAAKKAKEAADKEAAEALAAAEAEEADETDDPEDEGQAAVLAGAGSDESEDAAEEAADTEDGEEEEVEDAPAAPEADEKPKQTRRTAAVVEAEAAAKQAELEATIEALKAQLAGEVTSPADLEVQVATDRVLLEDGKGGTLREIGGVLQNDEWRAHIAGLGLTVARADAQSTQTFKFPLSLIDALAEVLTHVHEIR